MLHSDGIKPDTKVPFNAIKTDKIVSVNVQQKNWILKDLSNSKEIKGKHKFKELRQ